MILRRVAYYGLVFFEALLEELGLLFCWSVFFVWFLRLGDLGFRVMRFGMESVFTCCWL